MATKIASDTLVALLDDLAGLLGAGVPLRSALSFMLDESPAGAVHTWLSDTITELDAGADWLQPWAEVVPPVAFALLSTAQDSGRLTQGLELARELMQGVQQRRAMVVQALRYPATVIVLLMGVFWLLLAKLVPPMLSFLTLSAAPKGLSTQLVAWLSARNDLVGALMVTLLAGVTLLFALPGLAAWRQRWLFVRLGTALRVQAAASILHLMYRSGYPLQQALASAAAALERDGQAFEDMARAVERGEAFGDVLSHWRSLSARQSAMLLLSERSGRLDDGLARLVEQSTALVATASQRVKLFANTVAMSCAALLLALIVIGLFLPLYDGIATMSMA